MQRRTIKRYLGSKIFKAMTSPAGAGAGADVGCGAQGCSCHNGQVQAHCAAAAAGQERRRGACRHCAAQGKRLDTVCIYSPEHTHTQPSAPGSSRLMTKMGSGASGAPSTGAAAAASCSSRRRAAYSSGNDFSRLEKGQPKTSRLREQGVKKGGLGRAERARQVANQLCGKPSADAQVLQGDCHRQLPPGVQHLRQRQGRGHGAFANSGWEALGFAQVPADPPIEPAAAPLRPPPPQHPGQPGLRTVLHMGQREMLWSKARAKQGLQNVWPHGVVTAGGRKGIGAMVGCRAAAADRIASCGRSVQSAAAGSTSASSSSGGGCGAAASLSTAGQASCRQHLGHRTGACTACTPCHRSHPAACDPLGLPSVWGRHLHLLPARCPPQPPRRRQPALPPGLPAAAAAAAAAAHVWAVLLGLLRTLPLLPGTAPAGPRPGRGTGGPPAYQAHPQAARPAPHLHPSTPEQPAGWGRAQRWRAAPTVGRVRDEGRRGRWVRRGPTGGGLWMSNQHVVKQASRQLGAASER